MRIDFPCWPKNLFYEPRVDLKKKAESAEGNRNTWKLRNTLSWYFLSLRIFSVQRKHVPCCLSRKSTFSHRAAFLPVGLVVKEIRILKMMEIVWKSFADRVSRIKAFCRGVFALRTRQQWRSHYKSQKSAKYRNSQSLPDINHLIN